jgi:hypothetical protein
MIARLPRVSLPLESNAAAACAGAEMVLGDRRRVRRLRSQLTTRKFVGAAKGMATGDEP